MFKAEAARKQAAVLEEKKKKIVEERERAAANVRKKQERAEKREMEERAKAQASPKWEECVKIGEKGRVEDIGQEGFCRLETEERKRAEGEAEIQVENSRRQEEARRGQEDGRKRDQESRERAEQEEKRRPEEEERLRQEQGALRQTQQTEEAREPEQESRQRAEEKAPGNQSQRRPELVDVQSHVGTPRGEQREERQSSEGLGNRPADEPRRRRHPRWRATEDPEAKRAEGVRRLLGQAEEHRRQVGIKSSLDWVHFSP